jgi:hypothetical protein
MSSSFKGSVIDTEYAAHPSETSLPEEIRTTSHRSI